MAEIVNSLFGVDPESIRQARDTALQERAMQYAKMDPFQRATAGLYSGASRLGDTLGGMLGGVDPQLQKSSELKQLASQFDTTSAQGLQEYARALASRGFNQEALQVANAAQGFLGKQAATAKDVAAAARERQTAIPPALLKAQREAALKQAIRGLGDDESPEALQTKKTLQDELDALTRVKAPENKIQEVGVAVGTNKPVYTYQTATGVQQIVFDTDPATGQQVMNPYVGGVDRTTAKTSVSVDGKGQEEFVKKLGELDAKAVSDAMTSAKSARSTLGSLGQLSKLNDQQLISGSFAAGRLGATNLLNTLGLTSPADVNRLATSENYQKVAGDVILQTLGGKLGAGFSNEDRKFIEGLIPQLENSPKARRELISFMADKNREIISEATRLENYARENKGLGGFNPKIPFGEALTGVSAMSTEALKAEIARLKKGNK